ncbi:ABC transporter permease [Nonomuraea longicatena]|uniref:Transport permease protein n=1 Tax=Nonomuraea longicatena TaxID=83682 RepID=A0ABP4B5K5_9ACTN
MIRQTWLLYRHYVRITARSRFALAFNLAQPMFYLALFGPVFATFGAWETLVPGLVVQLALLSSGLAGFGIVFDQRGGVLDRLRVTPASRLALLLGRVLDNTTALLAQSVLLVAAGYAFGLRAWPPGVLLSLVLVAALGMSLAALSYAAALTLNEQLFAPVMTTAVVPLMLLSGTFLPMSMAPDWLAALSWFSPFRHVLEAMRELFAGTLVSTTVVVGVAVVAGLAVAGLWAGTRVFNRENA